MNYKKFSDLDSVDNISDNDLFAIASAKDDKGNFESNKVTFSQLRDQLDYDFDVVEVMEVTPPPEDDDTVYVMINGYRVAATRAKEELRAVYPTNIPRIIPAVSAFRVVKGKTYNIPFTTNELTLSNLTVAADTDYFKILKVTKFDDKSGYITLMTNFIADRFITSTVTLTDESSGISTSILITHTQIIVGLLNTSTKVEKNVITASWRMAMDSSSNFSYSVLEPKFYLSEDINFKVFYESDYFNQAYIARERSYNIEFTARIILEEPYSGDLAISFEDFSQGMSAMVFVNVDYQEA